MTSKNSKISIYIRKVSKEVNEMAANKYAGTQTEKNLQEAFAGESQARNKYTYFEAMSRCPHYF